VKSPAVWLLILAVAAAIPLLIAALVPRRGLAAAILLWLFAPLIVYFALIAIEIVGRPAAIGELGNAFYGLALIGPLVIIPWLILCALGFGIGSMLRKRSPAPAPPAAPPVAPPAAPVAAPRPAVRSTAPWRVAHIGFEKDGFRLNGLDVWALPWRKVDAPPVELPHPAYPDQRHFYDVYEVGLGAVRFAAGEVSNGVWGFYAFDPLDDVPVGLSADGSLRFVHDLGDLIGGRYDAVAPIARIEDVASGVMLFDGAAWASGRVIPQADGSLALLLRHYDRDTLFRIAPGDKTFINVAENGPALPLSQLAAAADEAHRASSDQRYRYIGRRLAPDGSLRVELEVAEWANSHWVNAPLVIEIATGRTLLDLWGTDWDAGVSFPRGAGLRLDFRRYHHGGHLIAEIDLAADRFTIIEPLRADATTTGPLDALPAALEEASRRASAAAHAARPAPVAPGERSGGLHPFLLVLGGAVLLLGAIAFLAWRFTPEPVQQLTPLPKMPDLHDDRRLPDYPPKP
jgi:hypothetical protein